MMETDNCSCVKAMKDPYSFHFGLLNLNEKRNSTFNVVIVQTIHWIYRKMWFFVMEMRHGSYSTVLHSNIKWTAATENSQGVKLSQEQQTTKTRVYISQKKKTEWTDVLRADTDASPAALSVNKSRRRTWAGFSNRGKRSYVCTSSFYH